MDTTRTVPRIWLYRVGLHFTMENHRRAMWSETWLSEQPETSWAQVLTAKVILAEGLYNLFADSSFESYAWAASFIQRLLPKPLRAQPLTVRTSTPIQPLNINAPEAALRLQRVGAGADRTFLGRLTPPITKESWYTDLPHRRHINVDLLAPKIAAGIDSYPKQVTTGGRTYTNVVFRRSTFEWEPVTEYRLLENPIRVWARTKIYHAAAHPDADVTFVPDEEY